MTNETMNRLYTKFLREYCHCSVNPVTGNCPCDDGVLCDRCMTADAQTVWEQTKANYEARHSYTLNTFLDNCIAQGGNWTAMYLTGIEACWPDIYKDMPDWTFEFDDVAFIVCAMVSDQDTTYAGVHVDKHISAWNPTHVIEYNCDADTFEFTLLDAAPDLDSFDTWYTENCGVTEQAIKEFKLQMHREQNIKDCSSILWELCSTWNEGKDEKYKYYSMDNGKVYAWLLEQDDFVNEAQKAETREELRSICECWFDNEVLEQPLDKFLWCYKEV